MAFKYRKTDTITALQSHIFRVALFHDVFATDTTTFAMWEEKIIEDQMAIVTIGKGLDTV